MTVKELMEELVKVDPSQEVLIEYTNKVNKSKLNHRKINGILPNMNG